MRIAVVYDCLFPFSTGGGERLYRAFAEEFAAAGHEVVYVTRRQWPAGRTPHLPGVRVVTVSHDLNLYDAQGNRRLLPAMRFAVGVLRHLLPRRRRYDAVFVSALPVLNVLATRLALAGRRLPVCVDWLEVWRPDQWRTYSGRVVGTVAGALQWLAVRASPMATCHSRLIARRLEALGVRSTPLVSPGLLDGVAARSPRLEPSDPPTVVYVGRHVPDKRVEALPAALAWARGRIPDLRATILGDGQTRAAVLAEVRRLGLEDVVDAPGFVSQEEMQDAVRQARCLVNPSAREGYGLVVVEACALGTPAVLVDAPDNAAVELVEPGVNGLVARSVAPQELGRAVVQVVEAGEPMRRSTLDWFERASREKTVQAAAQAVLGRLEAAHTADTARPARRASAGRRVP